MKIFVKTTRLESSRRAVIAVVADGENPYIKSSIFGSPNILKALTNATKKARSIRAAGGNPVIELKSRTSVSPED